MARRRFLRSWKRPRLLPVPETRLDISDSELAYLGYGYLESYGVSWRVADVALGTGIATGVVTGSEFHHNYFGAYTYGAVDMVWTGNEFHDNDVYGLDPQDDSRDFLVEGNSFHDNGKHGLIFFKPVC